MTTQAGFNAQEWAIVTQAPLLAGARVVTAERGGKVRESFAIGEVYEAAREMRGESALLDSLTADPPDFDLDELQKIGDLVAASNERLRAALGVLQQKASPDDVNAYKGFVLAVVQTAAEACREGGFIGIGGEEVTEREQAALDEISTLLGVEPGTTDW
jgi:hypothetical protein